MTMLIKARLPRSGGKCTKEECEGEVWEKINPGRPDIIGPGQHAGWECNGCGEKYISPPNSKRMLEQSDLGKLLIKHISSMSDR